MTSINERVNNIDDALTELGYVLKAIEELSVEKGSMTRSEIQNKIMELNEKGWTPTTSKTENGEA